MDTNTEGAIMLPRSPAGDEAVSNMVTADKTEAGDLETASEGPDTSFSQSFDARDWAAGFQRIVIDAGLVIDEELMLTWFANALMRGFDRRQHEIDALVTERDEAQAEVERLTQMRAEPIDMVIHCPACGVQHIDGPEHDREHWDGTIEEGWINPPHRSHLCHHCGFIWRPADVPTNGVAAVKTKGQADSPVAAPQQPSEPAALDYDGWTYLVNALYFLQNLPDGPEDHLRRADFITVAAAALNRHVDRIDQFAKATPAMASEQRDREISQLVDERDTFEHLCTVLAGKVGELLDADVGEWSNLNNPVLRAIHLIEDRMALPNAARDAVDLARIKTLAENIKGGYKHWGGWSGTVGDCDEIIEQVDRASTPNSDSAKEGA